MKNTDRKFIPFHIPDIGEEEITEVVETLRSGWITTGPRARQFEEDFATFLGDDGLEAIAVNSATAGLHLALEATGIGPGDEVIVPTWTFTATAEVVRYLGATPVFVDVDPDTLNITPQAIERAITERTRAIMPVHFAGLACDMPAILDIARRHGLRVIEDAAHILPGTVGGRLIGTLESDATVFSFYATKTITTGEGGMIVTRDPAIAQRCRTMRLHGISKDVFDRYRSRKPSWHYEVIAPGFKYNMPDLAAALGIHQLKKAWQFQERRASIAQRYDESFADLPMRLPPKAPAGETHSWHLYVLRIRPEASIGRDLFIERMAREGIGCSVHFIPLHLHPYWKEEYDLGEEQFPNAQAAFAEVVSLPIFPAMTDEDVERVTRTVRSLLS